MRLIDADMLSSTMYHMAFEEDSDMQKWDNGCWIKYKLFETVLGTQPTADIVRCEECIYKKEFGDRIFCQNAYFCDGTHIEISLDDYCSMGVRRVKNE